MSHFVEECIVTRGREISACRMTLLRNTQGKYRCQTVVCIYTWVTGFTNQFTKLQKKNLICLALVHLFRPDMVCFLKSLYPRPQKEDNLQVQKVPIHQNISSLYIHEKVVLYVNACVYKNILSRSWPVHHNCMPIDFRTFVFGDSTVQWNHIA